MRTLAIGDIHGCFTALTSLAAFVAFRPDDLVVTLGDHVNRGPASSATIDWLIHRGRTSRLVALRGNHEIMMMQARESDEAFGRWVDCGGDATLASYSPSGQLADIPASHWDFLERTLPFFETDTHFFVHANAYPDCPLEDQPEFMLYWESFDSPPPHESGKIMICGHTSQKSGEPLSIGHAICIDTGACKNGWLTCLDVETGRIWQANEHGETRSSWVR